MSMHQPVRTYDTSRWAPLNRRVRRVLLRPGGGHEMTAHANIGLIEIVAAELREMLGDEFDEATFLDTLDGETDFMDLVGALIRERVEAKSFETAAKEAAQTYTLRAKRMADRQTAISKALGALLDAADTPKVKHPLGTVSRTKGREGVVIVREDEIPTQLCRITRSPDKAAILKALQAGEDVPGAALEAGAPGISLRIR